MGIGAGLAIGSETVGAIDRFSGNRAKEAELDRRGVNVPWHQKAFNIALGPAIGGRLQEASLDRKLARTNDYGIPTRNAVGLGGEAALNDTAGIFRKQLEAQLGAQTAQINREFGSAGRYSSGQRQGAIERAQDSSRGAFTNFLNQTALQRFLEQQRLQTQVDIANANRDAQTGSGRLNAVTNIASAGANIYASNPEGVNSFFSNLFRGSDGGDVGGGGSRNTLAFADLKG